MEQVSVAGAGIAGLSTALALARRHPQLSIRLFEKQAALSAVGAGIQIGPNAFAAMQAISPALCEEAKSLALFPEQLVMRDWQTGAKLSEVQLSGAMRNTFGQPYGVLHRASLQSRLLRHVQKEGERIAVRLGETMPEKPTGHVIGADGIWSGLRRQLNPSVEPKQSSIALRALIPVQTSVNHFEKTVRLFVGPNVHAVLYLVRNPASEKNTEFALNVALFVSGARSKALQALLPNANDMVRAGGWSHLVSFASLLPALPSVCSQVQEVMEQIDGLSQVSIWPVFDLPPLSSYRNDKIILIGDAAHAMLPHLAQGAAFALEDAAVLAQCWPHVDAFLQARTRRWRRAQQLAARYQDIYHAKGAYKLARNTALRLPVFTPKFGGLSWVYAWQP